MSEWKEYKLEDVCIKITDGSHFSPRELIGGEKIIATVRDMSEFNFDVDGCKRISKEDYEKLVANDCKPLENDVLFSKDGTIGQIIVFDGKIDLVILSSIAIIRPNIKLINPKFLGYYLKSDISQNEIKDNYKSGSVIPRVILKDFRRFPIVIPSLPTQVAIAEILSSLDDKIELNNKINKNLEDLAQTLFKQWFVDFEFPNENGEPYKSSGGEMVESELGEIPKGWSISTFKEQLNVCRGLSYNGAGLTDKMNGVPMHNLNSVYEGGGYKFEGIKYYSGEFKERHIVKPWDLIVTNTEQGHKFLLIGCPAFVPKYYGSQGIFSHHIYKVETKEDSYLDNQFIYYLMLHPSIREQIVGCTNGTTVNMLKINGLEVPIFKLPPQNLVTIFSEYVKSVWEKLEISFEENQNLKELRDTLLPKLISGELEVKLKTLLQTEKAM